jgi:hypothetical protein
MRNAAELPDGYSGKLVITNFTIDADGKMVEPTWHREKDGKATGEPSIRADMETCIHKLLTLGKDVFVLWASDQFQVQDIMRVAFVPEDKRNPLCPNKWTVTASQRFEDLLKAEAKKTPSGASPQHVRQSKCSPD